MVTGLFNTLYGFEANIKNIEGATSCFMINLTSIKEHNWRKNKSFSENQNNINIRINLIPKFC